MLPFLPARSLRQVLFLGAHSDDIEIGCGGWVLDLATRHPDTAVTWVVFCSNEARAAEARASAADFLHGMPNTDIRILSFRDGHLPWQGSAVKEAFETIKDRIEPDLIFTHTRDDRHQDHRTISDLTWNTWRDHAIWEYEIPKYDGDLGQPNAFFPLTGELATRKTNLLMQHFGSQRGKRWFTADTFHAMLRLRGIESGTALAEAFHVRKFVLHTAD